MAPATTNALFMYSDRLGPIRLRRNSMVFCRGWRGRIRHISCAARDRQRTNHCIASPRRLAPSPSLVIQRGLRYGTYSVHSGSLTSASSRLATPVNPARLYYRAWDSGSRRKRRGHSSSCPDPVVHIRTATAFLTLGSGNDTTQAEGTLGAQSTPGERHSRRTARS